MLRSPFWAEKGQHCLAFLILNLLLGSFGQAQLSAPAIHITPVATGAPPSMAIAQKVLVQPNRLEMRLPMGYSTGTLYFTLFSEVDTEVTLKPRDSRVKFAGASNSIVRLNAYKLQTINVVILEAHTGVIDVLNSQGKRIEEISYTVAPYKIVNQSASLNYNPFQGMLSAGYGVSSVQVTPLAPTVNAGFGLGYDLHNGNVNGNIYINVRW